MHLFLHRNITACSWLSTINIKLGSYLINHTASVIPSTDSIPVSDHVNLNSLDAMQINIYEFRVMYMHITDI